MNHDRRIQALGGVNPDGAHWRLSEPDAVAAIETGRWNFYVQTLAGRQLPIVVAVSRYGQKYLKTSADGLQPDSLLRLPDCGHR
jgi:hypothetical protein